MRGVREERERSERGPGEGEQNFESEGGKDSYLYLSLSVATIASMGTPSCTTNQNDKRY